MALNRPKSAEPDTVDLRQMAKQDTVAECENSFLHPGRKPMGEEIEACKRTENSLREEQHLNKLLLDALPHFAMLIRKDRTILAANRVAKDAGAVVGGYCWQGFGQSNFISEEDKKYIRNCNRIPPDGTNCSFCIADKALETQEPTSNPELEAWGKIWDVHWVPLNREVYLHYAIDITERKLAAKARQKLTKDLGKRVNELNCLYGLSRLVETPGITLEQIFQGMVDLIPAGWQFPELTCARLILDNQEFKTDGFQVTPWRQSADIQVKGKRFGIMEVYCRENASECEDGPFQKEERDLLDAITERLGKIVDRKQSEEALQKSNDLLEIKVQQRTAELINNEENLAEAQRIAHLGNWVWDICTNELLWSDEVYRIFGYRPQEITATYEDFLNCVHPDDRRQVEESISLAVKEPGTDYNIDHRIIRSDGSERIVHEHGKVTFDSKGNPLRMIGTVHDITEQKKLEREILNISTDEQRRIGQELHDGLGQELTGLNYLAKSLHKKLQAKGLAEAGTAAELAEGIPQVVGQLQAIVKGLVPLEVDGGNLMHALLGLTENVQERTGVSCRFESRGRVQVRDDNTAVQLYRIAQEALNNAVKHGQPRHITLAFKSVRKQIRLEVCDDGTGISQDENKAQGSGLRIMRYRAGIIGGRFDIKQRTGGGTLVTCILPMEKRNDQR